MALQQGVQQHFQPIYVKREKVEELLSQVIVTKR